MAMLLTAVIAMVSANVVLRYGFASGLRPSVERSRHGLVWVVMLGVAVVLRRGEHLAVQEIFARMFPRLVPRRHRGTWARATSPSRSRHPTGPVDRHGTFDILVECTGAAPALAGGIAVLRPGGVIVQLGPWR